jgi:hypothetical protein
MVVIALVALPFLPHLGCEKVGVTTRFTLEKRVGHANNSSSDRRLVPRCGLVDTTAAESLPPSFLLLILVAVVLLSVK